MLRTCVRVGLQLSHKHVGLAPDKMKHASVRCRVFGRHLSSGSFLAKGIRAPQVLRVGRQRISPMIMDINSPHLEVTCRFSQLSHVRMYQLYKL